MMNPVLQSLTPLMVDRAQLRQAIALNSMGTNVSRAIGPAVGGLLVASVGVAWTFVADALSYIALIAALWWWKGAAARSTSGAAESFGPALRAGLRFALNAPDFQRVLLRAGSFFLFASAYWALLPLIARQQLQGDATVYGLLLTSVGLGAVGGALLLPALRRSWSAEAVVRAGTAVTVLVLIVLSLERQPLLAMLALALAGAAWIAVLTTANVAAQTQLPNWVRGRGLAVYLTIFYGAMTLGSFMWGQLADALGIPLALQISATLGMAMLALAFLRPLPASEPDLTPASHWPEPVMRRVTSGERGPVLVTVTYNIAPQDVTGFMRALSHFAAERLRDGAYQWGVFEDVQRPGHFVEVFSLATWAEHERQHRRVSVADAQLQKIVNAYHRGEEPPKVTHLVGVDRSAGINDHGESLSS
jgi:predicted MFS family arabinose efflux permease